MSTVNHRCPNPRCVVLLTVPRQTEWHRVRCRGCGNIFVMPPTKRPPDAAINRKAA